MAQKPKRNGLGRSSMMTGALNIQSMHPFENLFSSTDRYYSDIAKKIFPMLWPLGWELVYDDELLRRIALSLAAYFEDQVSQLGIWSSFIHRHRELYGRWLPWYDTSEDYYEDEVNLQDIQFLIWILIVSKETDSYTKPDDFTIEECATKVFDFLVDQFENAPVNQTLIDFLSSDFIVEDLYVLKRVFFWLTQACYLMAVPQWVDELRQRINHDVEGISKGQFKHDPEALQYFQSSSTAFRLRIGPLALYPKEWLVMIRQQLGVTKGNDTILAIECSPFYPFLVESNNGDTITLRSCRDFQYQVDANSFSNGGAKRIKEGHLIMTQLVYYNGRWCANGMCLGYGASGNSSNEDFLEELGESLYINNLAVDMLDIRDESVPLKFNKEAVDRLDAAVAENGGDRIFYFPNLKAGLEWEEKMMGNDDPNVNLEYDGQLPEQPTGLYVTEDHKMVTFTLVQSINDPRNPFYDAAEAYLGSYLIYHRNDITDELIAYLVKHKYFAHLSFDSEAEEPAYCSLIEDNLPFWATFMRQYPCGN